VLLLRMAALSQVAWSQKESKDRDDFKDKLEHLSQRYGAMELNYAKNTLE